MYYLNFILKGTVDLLQPIWTRCNELALDIHTLPLERPSGWRGAITEKARYRDNHVYGSPDYWYIRKIARVLKPRPEDVIYDIGSGLGRIICVMAREPVRRCVGVELFDSFCEIARLNAQRLRGRKAPIDIICADATTVNLSDGTIYLMFNPFGEQTMRQTLANLQESLSHNPRRVTVVYYNPVYESVFEACGWLERFHEFGTFRGLRVTFWRNRHAARLSPQPQ